MTVSTAEELPEDTPSATKGESVQFLTFTIGDEEYGADIMKVREIKGWEGTTRLPNAAGYMRGVINLRGNILPIFDLRARFGMGETEPDEKNVVIILAVEQRTIGILVDTVSDILTVNTVEIKPAPAMQVSIDDAYVGGLISQEDRMVVVLEVEGLFDTDVLDSAVKGAGMNEQI